jgi:DNA-binding IscR family transcriptional regulator
MCQLKLVLREALAAYLKTLDRVTLLDLIEPRTQLSEVLGMTA